MAKHYNNKTFDKPSARYTRDYSNLPNIARFPQEGAGLFVESTVNVINTRADVARFNIDPTQKAPSNYYDVIGDKLQKIPHNLHIASKYVKAYNSELQRLTRANVPIVEAINRLQNHTRLNEIRAEYRASLEKANSCYICGKPTKTTKAYIFKPSDFAQLESNLQAIDEKALSELREKAKAHFLEMRKMRVHKPNNYASFALSHSFETVTFEASNFGLEYHYADIKPHFRVYQNELGYLEYGFIDGLGAMRYLKRAKVNGKLITTAFTDKAGNIDKFYNPPAFIRRFNLKCSCVIK